MKCPHCGHGHGEDLFDKSKPVRCHHMTAGIRCDCPGWVPEVRTPKRIVNLRQYRTPRPTGTEWISPLDERGDYSGWDDAA